MIHLYGTTVAYNGTAHNGFGCGAVSFVTVHGPDPRSLRSFGPTGRASHGCRPFPSALAARHAAECAITALAAGRCGL
ncbi:hypothetical protein [Streptomyces bluensis]|uniref:hypothetical protein n=1 Tax=Streptomyces bluensis TaxID=33897 RepID=UPI003316A434